MVNKLVIIVIVNVLCIIQLETSPKLYLRDAYLKTIAKGF